MRLRPALLGGLVPMVAIAVAVALGTWASALGSDPRPSLGAALDVLPRATLVAGFTDWASIRDDLGLGDASTADDRAALTGKASLHDLTTRSVLGGVVTEMHEVYGWSAADLDWESYGRSPQGAAMVARFAPDVSIDKVESRLVDLGYRREGEVWTLTASASSTVGPELAATLGHLAIVPGRRLVVAADRPAYVSAVLATISGDDPSALSVRAIADVARQLAGYDTAVVQAGAFGCRATSVDRLGTDVQDQADAAVARAGRLTTPTFTGRGLIERSADRQDISFVAAFDSPAEASEQARVRAALATGPFIGRSGRVEDSLDLTAATSEGSVATLRFNLDPDVAAYMSGEGPLLFASCP